MSLAEEIDLELLEKLNEIEVDLSKVDDQMQKEIEKIAYKYEKLKQPIYDQRDELVNQVPQFWPQTFANHPRFETEVITEQDETALLSLTQLKIVRKEDPKCFDLVFTFAENDYFTDKTLTKSFSATENEFKCAAVKIHWKKGKEINYSKEPSAKKRKVTEKEAIELDDNDQIGFFKFLASNDPEYYELGFDIVHDLYPKALRYFDGQDDDDEVEVEEFNSDEE